MRPLITTAAAVLLLCNPARGAAQDRTPLARGDVAGTAGWIAVNAPQFDGYNDNWQGQGFFSGGAGWYWTDHLKTDVEIGTSTTAQRYVPFQIEIGGQRQFAPVFVRFRSTRVALTQRYQFGRNQWFHPSLGIGIDLVREHSSRREEPVFIYDQVTRQSRLAREAIQHPDDTESAVRALAVGGFKAYLTPRSFFLADMRVGFASRPEDVLLRVGFGVDF
jgi:hypothetical protein